MKATFDIPDEIYRRAKARSAMEGRPLRAVAIELFESWLAEAPTPDPGRTPAASGTRSDGAPWARIARPYLRSGMSHDLDDIRRSIAEGRSARS
jgi:hypothetical protein